jgi:hypothetical protein
LGSAFFLYLSVFFGFFTVAQGSFSAQWRAGVLFLIALGFGGYVLGGALGVTGSLLALLAASMLRAGWLFGSIRMRFSEVRA